MKRTIYSEHDDSLLSIEDVTPKHGDLCADCGVCMHCESECEYHSDGHIWVIYSDDYEVALKRQFEARYPIFKQVATALIENAQAAGVIKEHMDYLVSIIEMQQELINTLWGQLEAKSNEQTQ